MGENKNSLDCVGRSGYEENTLYIYVEFSLKKVHSWTRDRNIMGVINHFLTGFKTCFTDETKNWYFSQDKEPKIPINNSALTKGFCSILINMR